MTNVTITLDEDVARWARIRATEQDMSLSRLIGKMLREKMLQDEGYKRAMKKYSSVAPGNLKEPEAIYPERKDLYDR
jgi:hypothetical protein